jgi:hypothetical protein
MSALEGARSGLACCTAREGVVLLGGESSGEEALATAEVLRYDLEADELTFAALPPLSCGPRACSTALPIDESESAEDRVLLLGGCEEAGEPLDVASRVVKVDLATGACTPHPPLLYGRRCFAAARFPDGRVVCAGAGHHDYREGDEDGTYPASITAEVLEPPE